MNVKFIVSSIIALLQAGLFNGVGPFEGVNAYLNNQYSIVINPIFLLIPFLVPIIFILILYKSNDNAETVAKGTGRYSIFKFFAISISIALSVLVVGVTSDSNNLFEVKAMLVSSIYALIFSFIWFMALTVIGKKYFSKGSLEYWPS
jgi:hypothetical protein